MDKKVRDFAIKGVDYLNGFVESLQELELKYPGNKELASAVGNVTNVVSGLKDTIGGYLRFALSNLCNVRSANIVSGEEAENLLKQFDELTKLEEPTQ